MYLSVILICYAATASAFSASTRTSSTSLHMGGGRSETEKVQTKKEMFRDLREKLDSAAQIPGFFDVGQKMVCSHIYHSFYMSIEYFMRLLIHIAELHFYDQNVFSPFTIFLIFRMSGFTARAPKMACKSATALKDNLSR